MYFSSILLYLTHKATSLNYEDTIMIYSLSWHSYAINEDVCDGAAVGVYSSHEKAHQQMTDNVYETAGLNDGECDEDDKGIINIEDYKATYESKNGYFIEYKINEFDSVQ